MSVGGLWRRYDARVPSTPDRASHPSNKSLEDGPAGTYLHGGYTSCVEHQQSIAMAASQDTGLLRERGDDVVDHLGLTVRIPVLVRDVHAVTADEPNAKDNGLHVYAP